MSDHSRTTARAPNDVNVRDLTVFFDGACPLCRAEIGVYRNCTGSERIAFVDVAAASDGDVAPGLNRETALARFYVRRADGSLASGAAGFAQLWLLLPGWRWLGRIVSLSGANTLAELAYRGFLVLRPSLQWIVRRGAAVTRH